MVAIIAPTLVDNRLVAQHRDFADSTGCCQVVLAQRDELPFVWQHVELIRTPAIALPIAALGARPRRGAASRADADARPSCSRWACCSSGVATLVGVAVGGGARHRRASADPSGPAHDLVRQAASTIYDRLEARAGRPGAGC